MLVFSCYEKVFLSISAVGARAEEMLPSLLDAAGLVNIPMYVPMQCWYIELQASRFSQFSRKVP